MRCCNIILAVVIKISHQHLVRYVTGSRVHGSIELTIALVG